MYKKLLARWAFGVSSALVISFSLVPLAFAQLYVDVRCSELQMGTYPVAVTCGTQANNSATGTYSAGSVLQSPIFAGSADGNSYRAGASAKADYGTLGVSAYATATNTTLSNPDTMTLQLLTSARSQWVDTFTIGGNFGTVVDIRVDMVVHISDLYQASSDNMLSNGYIIFSTSNSDPTEGWCWQQPALGACGRAAPLVAGDNLISFTASVLAGTTAPWQSTLYAEAQVYNNNFGAGTVNVDAINTAHTYFTVLTQGATMGWESGNDYRMPSPVPEPETYAMMLAGLGLLGFAARRRKQHAA